MSSKTYSGKNRIAGRHSKSINSISSSSNWNNNSSSNNCFSINTGIGNKSVNYLNNNNNSNITPNSN